MPQYRTYEMKLWSMAPLLRPGDVLLVETDRPIDRVLRGEVIVYREKNDAVSTAHRVIGFRNGRAFPFRTKGDRNALPDDRHGELMFEGVVARRIRGSDVTPLRWNRIYLTLSVLGLFPGQRIPSWLGRSNIKKWFARWSARSFGRHA